MLGFKAIKQNNLNLRLTSLSPIEMTYISYCPCDIYTLVGKEIILKQRRNNVLAMSISENNFVFCTYEGKEKVIKIIKDELTKISRSLSIGEKMDNMENFLPLFLLNLKYLYENPTDDNQLFLCYQSAKNLSAFLINNPEIHNAVYKEILTLDFHYSLIQPLIASIFLIGYLKASLFYNKSELEALFITSLFKDIGLALIPKNVLDSFKLKDQDVKMINEHPRNSVDILAGRISLSSRHLKIIHNHHNISILNETYIPEYDEQLIYMQGMESIMVNIMDIIAAMISDRPFRPSLGLFDSLDLAKTFISEQYPQEFKSLVVYFNKFFRS